MKAAILEELHQPLRVKKVEKPTAGNGEAIVKIYAAALNHRDVWIQKGQYAGIALPCILGSDGAGIVDSVGDVTDEQWVGQEVLMNSALNWGDNEEYQSRNFSMMGMPGDGTFAEYIKVPVENLAKRPDHLSMAEAAAVPLAGLTAFRALFTRGRAAAGDKVLITGIGGGVAQWALLFAVAAGAEVYITSSSEDKLSAAIENGAAGGANYRNEDWAKELEKRAGRMNVIIDGAAGEGFGSLVELAEYSGRIVNYGGTAGPMGNIKPQRVFWKQLHILGSTMGSPREFEEMVNFIRRHKIKPIVDKIYPLEQINEAMARMEEGKQFGKIVVEV